MKGEVLGRYVLFDEIAAGGMASVHHGRLVGDAGFSRTVAIKRLHPQFAKNPSFVKSFLDEARLATRIRHPNVIDILDVVSTEKELFVVMELVEGDSLSGLLRAQLLEGPLPPRLASGLVVGMLRGLHAAHEATNEAGEPLGMVHRDVSPQNVLAGVDGVVRVVDFGVAKARSRLGDSTEDGQIKGKLSYMAPEQLRGHAIDRRTDVFAAAIVAWELFTGRRLFVSDEPGNLMAKVLAARVAPPSKVAAHCPAIVDAIILRGLERNASRRFATADDMADAVEAAVPPASTREIGEWVRRIGGDALAARMARLRVIESSGVELVRPPSASSPGVMPAGVTGEAHAVAASGLAGVGHPNTEAGLSTSAAHRAISRSSRSMRIAWAVASLSVFAAVTIVALVLGRGRLTPTTGAARDSGGLGPASVASSPASDAVPLGATSELGSPQGPPSNPPSVSPAVAPPNSGSSTTTAVTPRAGGVASTSTRAGRPAAPTGHLGRGGHGGNTTNGGPVPRSSCDPPFVTTADGIRRYKPECTQ